MAEGKTEVQRHPYGHLPRGSGCTAELHSAWQSLSFRQAAGSVARKANNDNNG
jgi:hypothetical protein